MSYEEIAAALEAVTRLSRYLMVNAAKEQTIGDSEVLACRALLPEWAAGEAVSVGDCRRYEEKVYRCRQAHTTQAGWEPEQVPAMWAVIDRTHAGTAADPIPAAAGMDYEYGKYYRDPEDGKVYLCKRGSETGTINLQYLPHALVGQYFEEV